MEDNENDNFWLSFCVAIVTDVAAAVVAIVILRIRHCLFGGAERIHLP